MAGIILASAGPGKVVADNTVLANGRFGIDVQNTSEVWIEGNRVSYNRGILQPDVTNDGGLLETKKIAAMGETCYMTMATHNSSGPLPSQRLQNLCRANSLHLGLVCYRLDAGGAAGGMAHCFDRRCS